MCQVAWACPRRTSLNRAEAAEAGIFANGSFDMKHSEVHAGRRRKLLKSRVCLWTGANILAAGGVGGRRVGLPGGMPRRALGGGSRGYSELKDEPPRVASTLEESGSANC